MGRATKPTQAQREQLLERSGGICEKCGQARATNWHHRKNASQGGEASLSNALHLCGSGTTGCHGWITGNPGGANPYGWSVRSWQNPLDEPVMYRGVAVLLGDDGTVNPAPRPAPPSVAPATPRPPGGGVGGGGTPCEAPC